MRGIRRLAQHLDISIGTVSRALNGRPDVNEATRKRVLEAAQEFGYVPNQSGRNLRQGTTNAIGFMIELNTETAVDSDNFFMAVFDGVQSVLRRHGLDLIVLPCPTEEDPLPYLQRFVARGAVDAMIISATQRHDKRIELLKNAKIPFIALGRSGDDDGHPWIDLDFEGVANLSVDRLVAHGHRHIALGVPSSDINLGYVFLEAYKSALQRHGIAFEPDLVMRANTSERGGYQLGGELLKLKPRPTAILLNNELMAIGLYRRIIEAGVQPGRDIAVIGFREEPQARFLSPTLTCFRMSLRDLGLALGESLLATLPGYSAQYPPEIAHKIWPLQLVPGESDAFHLPSEDNIEQPAL